jgi:hypothetical protein
VPAAWHGKCLDLPNPSVQDAGGASHPQGTIGSSSSSISLKATFWSGPLHEVEDDLEQWVQGCSQPKDVCGVDAGRRCSSSNTPPGRCTAVHPARGPGVAATISVQHSDDSDQDAGGRGFGQQEQQVQVEASCQSPQQVPEARPFAGGLLHAHNCVLVAPNAGLPVYPSWVPTLERLNQSGDVSHAHAHAHVKGSNSSSSTAAMGTSTGGTTRSTTACSNMSDTGGGVTSHSSATGRGGEGSSCDHWYARPPVVVISDYAEEAIHMSKVSTVVPPVCRITVLWLLATRLSIQTATVSGSLLDVDCKLSTVRKGATEPESAGVAETGALSCQCMYFAACWAAVYFVSAAQS